MSNIFKRPMIGYRLTAGAFVFGRWVEGTPVLFSFAASKQSPTPQDIKFLEEGRRTSKAYTLYTNDKLNSLQETTNPDQVVIDNEKYEVDVSAPWQSGRIVSHYKYIVTKMGAIEA